MKKLQDLRDSLRRYRTAIPEFVAQCRKELWPHTLTGSTVGRGISIVQLASIVVGSRRTGESVELLKARGVKNMTWDISRQEAIAQGIAAKYSK
jgi:hypothetical protein